MKRLALVVAATACGGTTTITETPGPRGVRADEHLAIAHREDDRAEELSHWPEPIIAYPAVDPLPAAVWYGRWDVASDHRAAAEEHRTNAAEIEQEYEQACGDTPAEVLAVSPLRRYGVGGTNTAQGVIVVLSPDAGPPDRLLAAMRCHRAWMMLGRADMDDCPLDLPGLEVEAHGDASAISLVLTVADPALVPELQRRASHDLEVGHKQ